MVLKKVVKDTNHLHTSSMVHGGLGGRKREMGEISVVRHSKLLNGFFGASRLGFSINSDHVRTLIRLLLHNSQGISKDRDETQSSQTTTIALQST